MIAKRTSSPPAGAKNFYAPIARFGFAVAAKALRKKGKDVPFLLGAAGTALAVEAIARTRGSFEAMVDRKLAQAGWSVDEPSRSELAGFAVDSRLGAVVNFAERKIARNGSVYVMRYCVTVCKEDRPEGEDEAARLVVPRGRNALAAPQHSKIWVRFLCISFRSKAAIDLDLCSSIARDLSPALDVADPIPHRYHLEVSSPGVERSLKKAADYDRFAGEKAKLKLKNAVAGQKVLVGTLGPVKDGVVDIVDGSRSFAIPLEDVMSARLVFEFGPPSRPPSSGGKKKKRKQ